MLQDLVDRRCQDRCTEIRHMLSREAYGRRRCKWIQFSMAGCSSPTQVKTGTTLERDGINPEIAKRNESEGAGRAQEYIHLELLAPRRSTNYSRGWYFALSSRDRGFIFRSARSYSMIGPIAGRLAGMRAPCPGCPGQRRVCIASQPLPATSNLTLLRIAKVLSARDKGKHSV